MQKQESSQNEGKNEKRFEKKLFLAILHDNSRGKSMKKLQQDWKNENDKKKKGSRKSSLWRFSATILEVKRAQIANTTRKYAQLFSSV